MLLENVLEHLKKDRSNGKVLKNDFDSMIRRQILGDIYFVFYIAFYNLLLIEISCNGEFILYMIQYSITTKLALIV